MQLTIIGSDNGLSPGRRQAFIWTNAGILLIGSLGTSVKSYANSHILIQENAFENNVCEMAVILYRSQCDAAHQVDASNWVWSRFPGKYPIFICCLVPAFIYNFR